MPYNDQHAGNIARLIAMKGDIAAQTALQRGQLWSAAMQNIGDNVSRSLLQIAQNKEDAKKKALQDQMFAEKSRELNGQRLMRELVTSHTDPATSVTNYKGVANELRTSGYADLAQTVDTHRVAAEDAELAKRQNTVNSLHTTLAKTSELMNQIQTSPDPATHYQAMRPMLVDIAASVDANLAPMVPPAYDHNTVTNLMDSIKQAEATALSHSQGVKKIIEARAITDDALRSKVANIEGTAKLLSPANTQEAWDKTLADLKAISVPDSVLGSFGAFDNGEGPKRAARSLMTPEQRFKADHPDAPNTVAEFYGEALKKYAKELGLKSTADLTSGQEIAFRTRWEAASRQPPGPAPDRPDPAEAKRRQAYEDELRQWENKQKTRTVVETNKASQDFGKRVPAPYEPFQTYEEWQDAHPPGSSRSERFRAKEAEQRRTLGRPLTSQERGAIWQNLEKEPKPDFSNVRSTRTEAGAALPPSAPPPSTPNYGPRWDEKTQSYSGPPKGDGFLGPLVIQTPNGPGVASEYSRDGKIDGKAVQYPLIVPTLTEAEVKAVLAVAGTEGGKVPQSVEEKARAYAKARIDAGKDVFAGPGEQNLTLHPNLPRQGAPAPAAPPAPRPTVRSNSGIEAEAGAMVAAIRRKEALGQDAGVERRRLAEIRGQVRR